MENDIYLSPESEECLEIIQPEVSVFGSCFFCLDVHGAYRDFDIALNGYLLTAQHVKVDTQGRLE